jgi:glycosyltransferase involved in cell wall biosynthesis
MRVLHLTTEFPPVIYGGMGTAVGGLVTASPAAGIEVGVLLVGDGVRVTYGGLKPVTAGNGVEMGRSKGDVAFFQIFHQDFDAAARVVAEWRPDVLHLHSYWLWSVAARLRTQLGKPLVYTVHSLDRAEYEIGQGAPEVLGQWTGQEAVIYGADRIIVLAQSERVLLEQYCPDVGTRVRVVGNGVDYVDALPRGRANDPKSPVVLFSGRFVERKGIRELIDAITIVLAEMPTVRFVLAGGHRHCTGEQMEAWLLPNSLIPHRTQILFTGWLTPEEMTEYYRMADILVVPSWYEPFGMVVLEGMVHGLAVAASAIGGPAEILEHEHTGILFPPRNAKALARAIIRLAKDPVERHRMAGTAMEEIRQRWLWPKIVEKMQAVYEELIPGRETIQSTHAM